jgi:hypothetical protein
LHPTFNGAGKTVFPLEHGFAAPAQPLPASHDPCESIGLCLQGGGLFLALSYLRGNGGNIFLKNGQLPIGFPEPGRRLLQTVG